MADLRYKRLGYVAINVRDRGRSTAFQQQTIGLETNPNVDPNAFGATLLRSGETPCELALYDGSEPGLRRIAFEMESEAYLAAAHDHLQRMGIAIWEVTAGDLDAFCQRAAFRFTEPNTGLAIELFVGDVTRYPAAAPVQSNVSQLGHVVLTVTDPGPITEFFEREMNFRVSDYIENVAFMRCFPNPLHHSLAITPGNENRLNHVNFVVHSLDDFGQAMNRTKKQNIEIVFGPGRHPPSGSIFLYFLDPDAMTFEFSTGMEEFPEAGYREARRLPRVPASFDYWLGARDPRHGAVGRFLLEEAYR